MDRWLLSGAQNLHVLIHWVEGHVSQTALTIILKGMHVKDPSFRRVGCTWSLAYMAAIHQSWMYYPWQQPVHWDHHGKLGEDFQEVQTFKVLLMIPCKTFFYNFFWGQGFSGCVFQWRRGAAAGAALNGRINFFLHMCSQPRPPWEVARDICQINVITSHKTPDCAGITFQQGPLI